MANKFNKYVEGLSVEEKKYGYANILHEFLVYTRVGMIQTNALVALSEVLHEMPPFLARDLEGFKDEWFWDKASQHEGVYQMLSNWFETGVVTEVFKKEMIDKEQSKGK